MNHVFVMISFLGMTAVITPDQEPAMIQHDISVYLPTSGVVEGWKPVGSPQAFVGDGLYDLINGGAVIYYEYGFKQTVTQEYESIDSRSIDLQMYEMTDPASAYGIYTFLRGMEGNEVDVGNEGMIAGHYMYFWKGNFLVALTASDSQEDSANSLLAIAAAVDKAIVETGQRPSLCNLLMMEGQAPARIYYLEGILALSNVYYFGADDIFGLKQGVVGDYDDFKIFVFRYDNEKESSYWYETAQDKMKKAGRFRNIEDHNGECSMMDEQGSIIQLKAHRNYVFVYLGTPGAEPQSIFFKIESNLR